MKIYKWKKTGSKLEYNSRRIRVREDSFKLPNGRKTKFSILERGRVVAILPITLKNEIIVVEQFRPAVNDITIDIPGGGINQGESPLAAAKRELQEETGIISKKLIKLGTFYPDSGRSEQTRYLYLAKELEFKEQNLDEEEFIKIKRIPYEKMREMIKRGKIRDITLALAFLIYEQSNISS